MIRGYENTRAVIRSVVAANGVQVSSDDEKALVDRLVDAIVPGDPPRFRDADGSERDLLAYVSFFGTPKNDRKRPSTEPNPFVKLSWNITSQHRLLRDDPQRAAQLQRDAAAAGSVQ